MTGELLAVGILLPYSSARLHDRSASTFDRALYPTVLVVIASYNALFAVIGGSTRAVVLESVVMSAFTLLAVAGFKAKSVAHRRSLCCAWRL